jgi:two-component system, chemotaxis family, CheB/CheR fusion protein
MPEIENKDKIKLPSSNLFPVVGVGASAGGLEAFKRLLKSIPEDSGMAFILVQHLEPTHESILTEILQKATKIPVLEITNNARVEPDHIYIIPSNRLLTATDGILQLSPRLPKNEKNMPIDVFFTSLAEVHQSHAIGVVLSGTATDGTLGLKAIKDHGGITFAQEQNSAAFAGMPQSAIDAEVVDFILTPEEIPQQLAGLYQTFRDGLASEGTDGEQKKEDAFRQLLLLIRTRMGVDFSYYKQTTIRRRILRRMGINKIEQITDYLVFCKENKAEQDILYQDLLIPVTDFFRDAKAYEVLSQTIFPLLLKNRQANNTLRIWVAGCSTGEEPYSIAMCLQEYLEQGTEDTNIQIFATDLAEKSIAKARSGIYSKKEVTGISKHQLEKYFSGINGNFQINKKIRDMCIFARHNFLKDPPFAKVDLVSCRNVLIYMESFLQKKALTTFHYALNKNGFLWLGKSETTAPASDFFSVFDNRDKIYARKTVPEKFTRVIKDPVVADVNGLRNLPVLSGNTDDFQKSADEFLLSRYTPAAVVINDKMDIVQFRGSTGTWLEAPAGRPSLNVLKMAREGLAFELRNLLHYVKERQSVLAKQNIPFLFMGKEQFVSLEITPLPNTIEPHYLILFKNPSISPIAGADNTAINTKTEASELIIGEKLIIENLRKELIQVREDMKNITEDQEASNEELQSANEELLSGSEELQSLNEELETSKEEIQSTNEELSVLNQELLDRNEQLNLSRIFAESIVATIREPLIILDKNIRVRSANKSFYAKFNAREEDTNGKSLFDLGDREWNTPLLRDIFTNIIWDEKRITDIEITNVFKFIGERTFLLNASQIFRQDNPEQLILLAIEDITEAKRLELEREAFTHELEKNVSERTTELKDSNVLLKHSNENLQQFAIITSHDLQEPLRKIRTFANILTERHSNDISEEAKSLLLKISLSAGRMSVLIRDVLHFSKLLDSKNAFEKVDLTTLLQRVISEFDLQITEKNAIVHYDTLPVIDAIPLQMIQLFSNLLSNALKFVKPSVPPVIQITSRRLPAQEVKKFPALKDNTAYCEIIFTDNGIGFDEQFSEQMFQIFQRLNSREQFEGTGIGLALCKGVVSNHHGEIYADYLAVEGTRFHIILPFEQKAKN